MRHHECQSTDVFSPDELQVALDVLWSKFDKNNVPDLTVARGNALPYSNEDGSPVAIAMGTENTVPNDAGRPAQRRAAPAPGASKLCCKALAGCEAQFPVTQARHHAAKHIEFDRADLPDKKFPCGQCAAFSAVQFTEDHASQHGCTVGLTVSQRTVQVRGHCKSHGDLKKIFGSWKPAQNCSREAPSTCVPLVCPACPHKRTLCIAHPKVTCLFSKHGKQNGIVHWAHNMEEHWQAAHQDSGPMPADLLEATKRKRTIKGQAEIDLLEGM